MWEEIFYVLHASNDSKKEEVERTMAAIELRSQTFAISCYLLQMRNLQVLTPSALSQRCTSVLYIRVPYV